MNSRLEDLDKEILGEKFVCTIRVVRAVETGAGCGPKKPYLAGQGGFARQGWLVYIV